MKELQKVLSIFLVFLLFSNNIYVHATSFGRPSSWNIPDLNADQDNDGLTYIQEVETMYLHVDNRTIVKYDPFKSDSDNDGILDGDEDFDNDGVTNIKSYLFLTLTLMLLIPITTGLMTVMKTSMVMD